MKRQMSGKLRPGRLRKAPGVRDIKRGGGLSFARGTGKRRGSTGQRRLGGGGGEKEIKKLFRGDELKAVGVLVTNTNKNQTRGFG